MPETKKTYEWEGAGTKLPDGHTIIETHDGPEDGTHAWAIFDQSARRPEDSDDGILWLDPTRCLNASTRHAPTIPLKDEQGDNCSTVTDTPTLLFLSRMLRWTIAEETRGHYYNVN